METRSCWECGQELRDADIVYVREFGVCPYCDGDADPVELGLVSDTDESDEEMQ